MSVTRTARLNDLTAMSGSPISDTQLVLVSGNIYLRFAVKIASPIALMVA